MKTSNKILLIAFVLFFASLGTYNYALRAEYLTGNYKNPYKDYITQNFKNFDEIEINAGTQINATIKSGESKVWLDKRSVGQVKITQRGKKLILDIAYSGKDQYWNNRVIITCPKLVSVKAVSKYVLDGKQQTDNKLMDDNYYNEIVIKDFKQDSLSIAQDNATSITLINNTLGSLIAKTGITANSTPRLNIDKGNIIKSGNFNIDQKSQLVMINVYIPKFKYSFSDSAKVTLLGNALKSITNPQSAQ